MKPATEMLEESIRERAYHLWEDCGRPQGRDKEFWERACELISTEASRSLDATPAKARGKRAAPVSAQEERPATPRRRKRKA